MIFIIKNKMKFINSYKNKFYFNNKINHKINSIKINSKKIFNKAILHKIVNNIKFVMNIYFY